MLSRVTKVITESLCPHTTVSNSSGGFSATISIAMKAISGRAAAPHERVHQDREREVGDDCGTLDYDAIEISRRTDRVREDSRDPQRVEVARRIVEEESLLIGMRGAERRDLACPRLVVANVGAEAGKVRHHHQLQNGQRSEHQQRGKEAGVGILSQRAQVVDKGVDDERDHNRARDESRQFAGGRRRRRRGRDRGYCQCGDAPRRNPRPRAPPLRPVFRDLQTFDHRAIAHIAQPLKIAVI